jgi:hypothetical protein
MLRRPGAFHNRQREEGCSSTAIAEFAKNSSAVWNNLAGRGSTDEFLANSAAVP